MARGGNFFPGYGSGLAGVGTVWPDPETFRAGVGTVLPEAEDFWQVRESIFRLWEFIVQVS